MFFKKKHTLKQNLRSKIASDELVFDDRLHNFQKRIKKISEDKSLASVLARQLTKLIKADRV